MCRAVVVRNVIRGKSEPVEDRERPFDTGLVDHDVNVGVDAIRRMGIEARGKYWALDDRAVDAALAELSDDPLTPVAQVHRLPDNHEQARFYLLKGGDKCTRDPARRP